MEKEKRLLITGFDPFGGEKINPAWEAVRKLPDRIGQYHLTKRMIPTVFEQAGYAVMEAAKELQPDVILCIGQAGGRSAITPERIGINMRSARIADNAGNQPDDEKICPDGADGYFSTLPVSAVVSAIQAAGYPAAVSNTAGTFVCNEVLYVLLHHYRDSDVKVGFIHVPYLLEQGEPSMPLCDTVEALKAAIRVIE